MTNINKIRIQTGVLTRAMKDLASYEKEATQLRNQVVKMVEEEKEQHDINMRQQCLEETTQMIPESLKRIEKAYNELSTLVEGVSDDDADSRGSEIFSKAMDVLAEAQTILTERQPN
ncbi:putative tubulin-specific chaperone A [Blattamonas nauphoetae]|uniref:Tubulin-specific chaperone A n=1 Tax=Blattamonas nauphoetae TaxID=2049346 RepID=A0ABQ9YCN5_9EUKA|nr:putative tubulin-specific chaperone A [Blattamonas nauphoetae]